MEFSLTQTKKGTAGLIDQFDRMLLVLCQLSCKVIGYVDSQTSPVCFDQSFLSQLNSHLFLIKLSVIKLSVIVNFITYFALINDKMHASECAEDTHC